LEVPVLNDRENRPALAVGLASHALLMSAFMLLAPGAVIDDAIPALLAMAAIFLFFTTIIAGIAWLVQMPIVRKLNDAKSNAAQAAGLLLFIVGMAGILAAVGATWRPMSSWSYAGLALLSGCASFRQFRICMREEPEPLPRTRLVP
jgi:hypothetical protein